MRIIAVIGANYGDEGKGLMTDYFAWQHRSSLVIRYNGGAQAGHTVVTPGGQRHVFGHVGSGFFAGRDTLLGAQFITNPLVFLKEIRQLEAFKMVNFPRIFVSEAASVTTPYEMLINQALERSRGDSRHGSCGMGINATKVREREYAHFTYRDMYNYSKGDLRRTLRGIRDYTLDQAARLSAPIDKHTWNTLDDLFLRAVDVMRQRTSTVRNLSFPDSYDTFIFEGAQGLLLSADNKDEYPHVTASLTGCTGLAMYANKLGYPKIETVYVTRPYLTRHGAGPLPGEDPKLSFPDDTNVQNEFQGKLRFAPLDIPRLLTRIKNDAASISQVPVVAMTCLDQVPNSMAILDKLINAYGAIVRYRSYGRTRNRVTSV